ncbi:MAG: protein-export chaperone SecB [Burkholderiaceae bacterium]|nr:protein-export chaperone SecB [Burkholderiaceae bacterium]MBP7658882.1 protein-export chaperone SecB [Burkholderiaceae bacterium]
MSAQQSNDPVFGIQRVYLKDLSLEIPNAPQIFLETQAPSVEIQIEVASQGLVEGIFESNVTVTVTTKAGDKVAFLVEAKQAGIFEVRNVPAEQLPLILNVVCPNIIYPYLRSNVADIVQRAGFPPIHLAEINFEALYQQRLAQQQEEAPKSSIYVPNGAQ